MAHEMDENIKYGVGIAPAVHGTTEVTGTGVDMAKYNNYVAAVVSGSSAAFQGALTVVIAESTDNVTFSDTYLATMTLVSSTASTVTAIACDSLEVRDEEMSDGYRYLRIEITPATGTGNLYSVINEQHNPRYGTA